MPNVPSKKVIQDAFQGASTRRAYATYQRQFEAYCVEQKDGINPVSATVNDCTDFFHHLYSLGRKAPTVDAAKTALVSYFNQHNVYPNPAQDTLAKRYVVVLQKFNRLNNIDEEKRPTLSQSMNSRQSCTCLLISIHLWRPCCNFYCRLASLAAFVSAK